MQFLIRRSSNDARQAGRSWQILAMQALISFALILICFNDRSSIAKDELRPQFYRAVNLGGPALMIAGHLWEGDDAAWVQTRDQAFENQAVPLIPEADEHLAQMIRSSRWNGRTRIELHGIEPGDYKLRLYVWEDNNSETFSLTLNNQQVAESVQSGDAGQWQRLGPYAVTVNDTKQIVVSTNGGAANLSGIEVWRGSGEIPDSVMVTDEPLPETPPELSELFATQVTPILANHCVECHGRYDPSGGLDLSTWSGFRRGGDTGPVFDATHPTSSLLLKMILTDQMPQERPPLSSEEKQLLTKWVEQGAGWSTREIEPYHQSNERRAGYDWWSLQPLRKPAVPLVTSSKHPRNEIDAFIDSKLEAEHLEPAEEADGKTLIRRLSFDLLGLPPAPEMVESFLQNDEDPRDYEQLVDRLLESPHYGEHWARHWLDVVRFGESQGYERNRIRENAWRYRDWVIDAFNHNLPYDEFVRQQIAGDVLAPDDLNAWIATGYHVCGTWDMVGVNEGSSAMQLIARQDHMEDLVGTLGQAFLGLTLNCCRCHDHKFDPLPQTDYYRMAALLGGIQQQEKERGEIPLPAVPGRLALRDFQGVAHIPYFQKPLATFVYARGDSRQPRELVTPAGLSALQAAGLEMDLALTSNSSDAERRQQLALWLTSPMNPLTARVFVNRVWYYHFGEGIVNTPSDFGFNGGRPSHPELLDWLASTFIESGYDVKRLHRLIVTSSTWRQKSSRDETSDTQRDGENRWFWRANRRRLEGESIRDAMLFVSGAMNAEVGGPSFRDVHVELKENHEFTDPTNEFTSQTSRRSIYRLWARSGNLPLLESLDCPDPTVTAPRRASTTTPLQALSLLHNGWVVQVSQHFAKRVQTDAGDALSEQVKRAYFLALARQPTDRERTLAVSFVERHGLPLFCQALLNTNEFLFID